MHAKTKKLYRVFYTPKYNCSSCFYTWQSQPVEGYVPVPEPCPKCAIISYPSKEGILCRIHIFKENLMINMKLFCCSLSRSRTYNKALYHRALKI